MPIPKHLQGLYGKIIGHLINSGYSHEVAKKKTEKAIRKKKKEG